MESIDTSASDNETGMRYLQNQCTYLILQETIYMKNFKVFVRNMDTYRALIDKGDMNLLEDFSSCLDNCALLALDKRDVVAMEEKAWESRRRVEVGSKCFSNIERCPFIVNTLASIYEGIDMVIIISGNVSYETFCEYIAERCEMDGNDRCIHFGLINRPDQEQFRITYVSY